MVNLKSTPDGETFTECERCAGLATNNRLIRLGFSGLGPGLLEIFAAAINHSTEDGALIDVGLNIGESALV